MSWPYHDFEKIYYTMTGDLLPECCVPWVEDAFVEGTVYNQCYKNFWIAREHLCERFGMEWEDDDLELFMNSIMDLGEDIAKRMFRYGTEYAKRGYKL